MSDTDLLTIIVKAIVVHEDHVKVERTVDEQGVLLTLQVHQEDMGKLIGKAGNTAKGIRTVIRCAGMKVQARVNVKIIEPEGSTRSHDQETSA